MKDLAIYGAGGFGREIACLINRINEAEPTWNLVGFFDDGIEKDTTISHFGPCLGGMEDLNGWDKPIAVAICVGSPNAIEAIVNKITNPLVEFPNIIAPNFSIADRHSFHIGKGNIIQGGCAVSCDVTIGDFNVLNGSIVFGHDGKVGNYNCFMPAIRVSGEVEIGNTNFFGVGSIILQRIKIGNHIRLGAGSVLMTKPKDGGLYIGVPAKMMKI